MMEYRSRVLALLVLALASADCRAVSRVRVSNDGPGPATFCVNGRFQGTVEAGHAVVADAAGQASADGEARTGGWRYHSFLSGSGDLFFAYVRDAQGQIYYAEESLPAGEEESALSLFGSGLPDDRQAAAPAPAGQACDLDGLQRANPQVRLLRSPVAFVPAAGLDFESVYGMVRFPSGNVRYTVGIDLDRNDRTSCNVRLKAYADRPSDPGGPVAKIEHGRASRQGRFLQCSGRMETEVGTLENQFVSVELHLVGDRPATAEGLPLHLELSIQLPGWLATAPLILSSELVY